MLLPGTFVYDQSVVFVHFPEDQNVVPYLFNQWWECCIYTNGNLMVILKAVKYIDKNSYYLKDYKI